MPAVRRRGGMAAAALVLLPGIATAQGSSGPLPPQDLDLWAEALRIGGYLVMLVALALAVAHVGRRLQPRLGGGGPIRLLGGRNLAPGVGVRLIQVGSRGWLIGVTRERVSLLAEMGEEELRAIREQGP